MNLALFDFDGTITNKDTFTGFIYYAVGRRRLMLGKLFLAPVILGYKMGVVPAAKARERVAGFGFKGRKLSDICNLGGRYAERLIPDCLRPEAMDRIEWHQAQGDHVVIVSAGLDVYLKHWCETHALDLICSTFKTQDGRITGAYECRDCSGLEKAARVKQRYDLKTYDIIYGYGDTVEDREMLALADVKYLNWICI